MIVLRVFQEGVWGRFRPLGVMPKAEDQASERSQAGPCKWAQASFYSPLQGDLQRTNIQLDFGDGIAVSYANFSPIEDGIKHVYKSAGIFQVTAYAENNLGSDTAVLFLHVVCK